MQYVKLCGGRRADDGNMIQKYPTQQASTMNFLAEQTYRARLVDWRKIAIPPRNSPQFSYSIFDIPPSIFRGEPLAALTAPVDMPSLCEVSGETEIGP